jgi:hypothetical protein
MFEAATLTRREEFGMGEWCGSGTEGRDGSLIGGILMRLMSRGCAGKACVDQAPSGVRGKVLRRTLFRSWVVGV